MQTETFAGRSGNSPVDAPLSLRLSGMLESAATIKQRADAIKGRLFGYSPVNEATGSSVLKAVPQDCMEDTVSQLAGLLNQIDITLSQVNDRI